MTAFNTLLALSAVGRFDIRTLRAPVETPELASMQTGDEPPEWVHLVPFGQWLGHSVGPFSVGPDEGAAILANFEADGILLAIDYEHQTLNAMFNGKPAPAAGWIDRLELRENGVWGHIERWTDRATAMLVSREYRYLSPVLVPDSIRPDTGRPSGMSLLPAALTNIPFLRSSLEPVMNRAPIPNQENPVDFRLLLCSLLGLALDTSDDDIKAAADNAKGPLELGKAAASTMQWDCDALPDGAKAKLEAELKHEGFVSLAQHADALRAAGSQSQAQAAEQDRIIVQNALESGKLTPNMKAWFEEQLAGGTKTRAAAMSWLEKTTSVVPLRSPAKPSPSTKGGRSSQSGGARQSVCSQLGIDPKDLPAAS